MRILIALLLLLSAPGARAENWVEVGADPEAKFFVDVDSIEIGKDSVRVVKRGVYNNILTENFGGKPTSFRHTLGIVELDCKLRVNRVIKIDMLNDGGEVVWSSGFMQRRMWEDVRPRSHAESTLDYVCSKISS